MTALGHFQPLSLSPGERLVSAKSGHSETGKRQLATVESGRSVSISELNDFA